MSIIITCNAGSFNMRLVAFDATTMRRESEVITHSCAEADQWFCSIDKYDIVSIGHRVVHGGQFFIHPTLITDAVLETLRGLIPLAPLHQPAAIELIETTRNKYPNVPHIACFDTAFHHTLSENQRRFAIPRELHEAGIMRYGFHGLSFEYVANIVHDFPETIAKGRVIVVHLGGGSSACAMHDLKSVACTTGFSTLDGLMMGTRCGAIDPGILLYLMSEKKYQ